MNGEMLLMAEKAIFDGNYENAHHICDQMLAAGSNGCAALYRALAEIGMTDLSYINCEQAKLSVNQAFQQFIAECGSIDVIEQRFVSSMALCVSVSTGMKARFEASDETLKKQYMGTEGIDMTSNSPEDMEKILRVRTVNSDINNRRKLLQTNYEDMSDYLLQIALTSLMQSELVMTRKHELSLAFLDRIMLGIHSVEPAVQQSVRSFVADVKKARNDHYWKENAARFSALSSERTLLQEKLSSTLTIQLQGAETLLQRANESKEKATQERARYKLFNFADRKPLTDIIEAEKETIKILTKRIRELKEGICEECDPFRARLAEINAELELQR